MSGQVPALRLRLPRIEKKPKAIYAARWHDFANVARDDALYEELYQLVQSIRRGEGAPEMYYRAGIDRDADWLLEEHGIMHLHLGGKDSDVLVFLIQYADRVVLLESNSHVRFRTKPPGKNILALSQSWLANLERDMQTAAEAAQTASGEKDRQDAETHRARLADSIAAFKAKAGLK